MDLCGQWVDSGGHGGASFSSVLRGPSSCHTVGYIVAYMLNPPFPWVAPSQWLSPMGILELDHSCPCARCFVQVLPVNLTKTVSALHCRLWLFLCNLPPTFLPQVSHLRHRLKVLPSSSYSFLLYPSKAFCPGHPSHICSGPDVCFLEGVACLLCPCHLKHVPFCISPPQASLFALSWLWSKLVFVLYLGWFVHGLSLLPDWEVHADGMLRRVPGELSAVPPCLAHDRYSIHTC